MKINLKFHARFQKIFDAVERQLELEDGADVGALLNMICDSHDRRIKIFGKGNNLRPNVLVRKNGRFIIHLDWLKTKLADGDHVEILSLVSGG